MPTSRPATPIATSDTSSDGGSLSDLESGWTDLETNPSNGRHSPTTISETGDNEDTRGTIGRYDGWEGLTSERDEQNGHDIGEDTSHVRASVAGPSRHLSAPQEPELTLKDWVADAVASSLISDDETSTPHMSFHSSSSPLRLSFPDPLSSSDQDLLPSHVLSRTQSRSTDGSRGVRNHYRARTESTPSVTACSAPATTPSDASFPPLDEDVDHMDEKSKGELPLVDVHAPVVPYALSIILLGHPPLPLLKQDTLSTIVGMVATILDGSPWVPEGMYTGRIREIYIYARKPNVTIEPEATPTHSIIIEDLTSGMSPSSSFTSIHCPTLALVFIQHPLSSSSLPPLPQNTRYLPLLLPSILNGPASSLLDLSPSVLFEHSTPNINTPDIATMKAFALQQCDKMGINGKRLDGSNEVFTVQEFSNILSHDLSSSLRDVIFLKEVTGDGSKGSIFSRYASVTAVRKQIVFISAFFIALLFGLTILFRGPPAPTPRSDRPTDLSQGQKTWSFLHPFVSRPVKTQAFPTPPELFATSPESLIPTSLKSLTVSFFLPDSVHTKVVDTPTGTPHGKGQHRSKPAEVDTTNHPATIDAPTPHLTIDAPYSKSLSLLSQTKIFSRPNSKDKEFVVNDIPDAQTPFWNSPSTSISTRISNALAPLFDRVQTDIREILEAIDALLQTLLQLRWQTAYGVGDLIHVLSEHWQVGQGVQELAGKVHRVAQTVGEKAVKRHARAQYNARRVRDVSHRYVNAARLHLKKSVERARGNAKKLREHVSSRRYLRKEAREHARLAAVNRAQQARAVCGGRGKARCSEYVFDNVMAFIV